MFRKNTVVHIFSDGSSGSVDEVSLDTFVFGVLLGFVHGDPSSGYGTGRTSGVPLPRSRPTIPYDVRTPDSVRQMSGSIRRGPVGARRCFDIQVYTRTLVWVSPCRPVRPTTPPSETNTYKCVLYHDVNPSCPTMPVGAHKLPAISRSEK